MSSFYVCKSCRRHLLRRFRLQWNSRATFISVSHQEAAPLEPVTQNGKGRPRDQQKQQGIDACTAQQPSAGADATLSLTELFPKLFPAPLELGDGRVHGRYSRGKKEPVQAEKREEVNVFRKYIPKDGIAEISEHLANPKVSTAKTWMVFLKRFDELREDSAAQVTQEVEAERRRVLHRLFLAVVSGWCAGKNDAALPKPTELIENYQKLKMMDDNLWHKMQGSMLFYLVKMQRMKVPFEECNAEVISELLHVWQSFFYQFRQVDTRGTVESGSGGWASLPKPADVRNMKRPKKFIDRFFHFAPNFPRLRSRDALLTTNALSTFAFLVDQMESPSRIAVETPRPEPFITFIAQLLVWSELPSDPKPVKGVLEVIMSQEDSDYFFGLISKSLDKAMAIVAATPDQNLPASLDDGIQYSAADQGTSLSELYIKRLGRALENQDVTRAEEFWHEARRTLATFGMSTKLYRHFLRAFMALRQPNMAIDVWNNMVTAGVKPDVAAWTAMMDGCQEAKEPEALETVWHRMLSSGVQPDVGAWTARIHGLVSCRKWDMGLRAFEEMARVWLNAAIQSKGKQRGKGSVISLDFAAIGDVGHVVKPTTATLNALVTGLARWRQHDAIARVLAWAHSHGIKSNAATYNGLMIAAFREKNPGKAMQLLQDMDSAGVQPDIVTFTIVLDSLFRTNSIANLSEDEQQDAISKFLTEMENRGLKTNAYIYSTLIDRLLKHQNNVVAARAMLDHMHARGISPEATIYTILITHYFNQDPPDFAAIDALWHRIPQEQGSVDMIFYDRMIEGYARYENIGKMMTFLTRMSKEGKRPGWWALSAVIKALANAGDFGRIKEIVRDVYREEGLFKDGCRGRTGKDDFWALVDSLGVSIHDQETRLP